MKNAPREAGRSGHQTTAKSDGKTVAPAQDETHEARCRRCHRPLRTALAVAAGLGPICAMAAIARVPLRPGAVVDADQLSLPIEAVSVDV